MTDTPSDAVRSAIAGSFAAQGLMQTLGARIAQIEAGRVTLELPIAPHFSQQHGFAHAGATFALGDSASGYAALSMMPEGSEVLTAEMKINLLAPAKGTRLIAVGEVLKPGRRLIVTRCMVRVEDAEGRMRDVAAMQGTMVPA